METEKTPGSQSDGAFPVLSPGVEALQGDKETPPGQERSWCI